MKKITTMLKTNYEFIFCIILLLIILGIAINPSTYIDATYYGISIWAKIVLPSIFCFFFLTKLFMFNNSGVKIFSKIGRPFAKIYNNENISFYIFVMSIISGYPIGVKLIAEYYEKGVLDESSAHRLLALSSTSGPIFILGSLTSKMLNGNSKIGIIILTSHIVATLLLGLMFRNFKTKNNKNIKKNENLIKKNTNFDINSIMYDTIISVFMVGGFIALCFTLLEFLSNLSIINIIKNYLFKITGSSVISGVFKGIIEMTTGCLALSKSTSNPILLTCLLTGLVTFGGLSIHLQSNLFLSKVKIKYGFFLKIKIIQTIIAVAISLIISLIV